MSGQKLIVFVKAPRPGMVKTRLGLGAHAECAAYQQLAQTVLAQVSEFRNVELRFTPSDAESEIRPWLRDGWSTAPQGEGDLGARLNGAFADAFTAGAQCAVIIGSDCPYVCAQDIRTAWTQLQSHDLVLGPAEDGGYWLIGLRATQPVLFNAIPWSSSRVLDETLARAKTVGLKTSLLRTLSDVDTAEDWKRFISAEPGDQTQHRSPAED